MKKIFFIFCIFLFFPTFIPSQTLILPFENKSNNKNFSWISESISYSLEFFFDNYNLEIISQEERNQIFEEFQIPFSIPFSKATMIKLGNRAKASKILYGEFKIEDEKIYIKGESIELKNIKPKEIVSVEGELKSLIFLQNLLAWKILNNEIHIEEKNGEEFLKKYSDIPLSSWENFIKGMIAKEKDKKESFFKKSLENFQHFPFALWEISKLYFQKSEYEKSLNYLMLLKGNEDFAYKSSFLLAMNFYNLERFERAIEILNRILKDTKNKDIIYNNIGVCYAKLNNNEKALEYFNMALDTKKSADYFFNKSLVAENTDECFDNLKNSLQINHLDFNFHNFLYNKLIKNNLDFIAKKELEIIKMYFSKEPDKKIDNSLNFLKIPNILFAENSSEVPDKNVSRSYIEFALNSIKNKDYHKAITEIKKAIYASPYESYNYYLLGWVYFHLKLHKNALEEIEFSLWLKEDPEVRSLYQKLRSESNNLRV
ncbi:MAG: tetratricopeptide repeat protein [Acidobacteriota bacterium]